MNTLETLRDILNIKRSVEVIFQHGTIRVCVFGKLESDAEGFYVRHANEGTASANFSADDVLDIKSNQFHSVIRVGMVPVKVLTFDDLTAWVDAACTYHAKNRPDTRTQRRDMNDYRDECIRITAPADNTAEHRSLVRHMMNLRGY
jgi:hypothetical protein